MISLGSLRDSLEGAVPSVIATADPAGVPNISYLSHVHYVDEAHVALTNQFFSKTAANIQNSGRATLMVVNGRTGLQHLLDLQYVRSEQTGPLYDRLRVQLDVGHTVAGMEEVMRLRAVDIYRVTAIEKVDATDPLSAEDPHDASLDRIVAVNRIARKMAAGADIEDILDQCVDGLAMDLGFSNVIIVVPDETGAKLVTIASRGYASFGFAAETQFGSGTIGLAASARVPVRISDLGRTKRYVAAIRSETTADPSPIEFPSLATPRSQLAIPIEAGGQLFGVLFAESVEPFAFTYQDEEATAIIAAHLGTSLMLSLRSETSSGRTAAAAASGVQANSAKLQTFNVHFNEVDGTIAIDGDYLIRGVPGRLLYYLVSRYIDAGAQDFSNRELRQARELQLPDFKDNLETRLILLRRRLDEKSSPIRIIRTDRGKLRLEVTGRLALQTKNS